MKKLFYILCFMQESLLFAQDEKIVIDQIEKTEKISIHAGENLQYNVYYSFFKVGELSSIVDDSLYNIYGRNCYKVDMLAKTTSISRWFASLDEYLGAYVDNNTLKPTMSYRYIQEDKYTYDEVAYFDYPKKEMRLTVYNKERGVHEERGYFPIHSEIYDAVGMYVNFRNINLKNKKIGDVILLSMYLENKMYPIAFKIDGYETIKIKAGKFDAIKIIPTLPNNDVFNKEYPITIWVSNDDNHLILSINAKAKVGKVSLELKSFSKVKNKVAKY